MHLLLARSLSLLIFRLGLDYVDLYLMHSAMGGKTLETWDAMVEIKENGLARFKVLCAWIISSDDDFSPRSIGVANFNKHHLKQLKQARPGNLPMGNGVALFF